MIHVCFGLYDKTGRYSKFTGTAMLSLFENTSADVTVHILHDDTLTQDNREKFIYLAGRHAQAVKFYNVEELCADRLAEMIKLTPQLGIPRLTVGAMYRLLIPQVLPADIDRIIYLDSDIIVNLDLNELWQFNLGEKILAGVPEISAYGNSDKVRQMFQMCARGFVRCEDYFNSGVLLIDLNFLRASEETIADGLKFINQNPQCAEFLDQDVLNYCFSTAALKLPAKFDRYVNLIRQEKEPPAKKIYHYAGGFHGVGVGLDMRDPFNRLWLKYFSKTPWFDEDMFARLCEKFLQAQADLKKSALNLLAATTEKPRVLVSTDQQLEVLVENFSVREDEEVLIMNHGTPLKSLIDLMSAQRGKKFFLLMLPNFPFKVLEEAGFVRGEDFFDGLEFLAETYNSYPFVTAL